MTEFRVAARRNEIAGGAMKIVEVAAREIVIVNIGGGRYYALANACTCVASIRAPAGRLGEGKLTGDTLVCPVHHTVFSVATGAPLSGFNEMPVRTFEVLAQDGLLAVATRSDTERRFRNDCGFKAA